jgi:hypothetical protein
VWLAGSRDCRCVGSRQRGTEERGRMKKWVGFVNWAIMFLGRAEEHDDPPYVPDLAKEHKSLCFSEI